MLPSLGSLSSALREEKIDLVGRVGVRFYSGMVEYAGRSRLIAVLPHPSWLARIGNSSWATVKTRLAESLGSQLAKLTSESGAA